MARSPSFAGLQPSSPTAPRSKRANRRSNTLPEVLLRRELWRMGLHYRKNVRSLPGQPDIAFPRHRVLVFCDGDFWHGRDWPDLSMKVGRGTYASCWVAKIASKVDRNARITAELERDGWRVIRLCESDIRRAPQAAAAIIQMDLVNRPA